MTLQWVQPWALSLLLLVPAYFLWEARRGAAVRAIRFPRSGALARGGSSLASYLALAPEVLRVLAFVLLVVALARPRTAAAVVEEVTEGIPMMIAFDVSSSMLAEDFAPQNRLQVAKETTAAFIAGRRNDPIGLVPFAGEAITQVPLTTDYRVLFAALDNLDIGLLEDGTAIGMGLATAANRLREVPGEEKVIILMSDGENNRGVIEPMDAAQTAAALGIRVFTVGVGSDEPAPVPLRRGPAGFEFAELPVGLDEELLREIAATTGGEYFRAGDPEALRSIFQELDRLVASPVQIRRYVDHRELYLPLVLLGTMLLLVEWFVRGSRWGRMP